MGFFFFAQKSKRMSKVVRYKKNMEDMFMTNEQNFVSGYIVYTDGGVLLTLTGRAAVQR